MFIRHFSSAAQNVDDIMLMGDRHCSRYAKITFSKYFLWVSGARLAFRQMYSWDLALLGLTNLERCFEKSDETSLQTFRIDEH